MQTQGPYSISSEWNHLCFQGDTAEHFTTEDPTVVRLVASKSSEFHNLHQGIGRKWLILGGVLRVGNMVPNQFSPLIEAR